jgi:hypothetical protein
LFAPAGHEVPSVAFVWLQVPLLLHASTVQGLPSSQDAIVQVAQVPFSMLVS